MTTITNPFTSARLVYRGFNSPQDDAFFHAIQSDPIAFSASFPSLVRPVTDKLTSTIRDYLTQNCLLFVVICLQPISETATPEPIGTLFLKGASADQVHHRSSELGIDIKAEFQRKGYGGESIRWALEWAFEYAGLHRVELCVLGFNEGVSKLYERCGFKLEGRKRENLFFRGRWWDELLMGVLEGEWRAGLQQQKGEQKWL